VTHQGVGAAVAVVGEVTSAPHLIHQGATDCGDRAGQTLDAPGHPIGVGPVGWACAVGSQLAQGVVGVDQ
jgi:hypothetical protein